MSRINKSAVGTVSRDELGNLLDNFKTNILGSLSEKIDTLKVKNKKKLKMMHYQSFVPNGEKKHVLRECPLYLKSVEACVICVENHDTKECPSIPGLKVFYQEEII